MSARPLLLLCVVAGLTACQNPPSADGNQTETDSGESSSTSSDDAETGGVCEPGQTSCADPSTLDTCAPSGQAWSSTACEGGQVCDACAADDGVGGCLAACVDPCAQPRGSTGCSFYATGLYQATLPPGVMSSSDAIVVVNPDPDHTATVELYWNSPFLGGEALEANATLAPGESAVLDLASGLTSDMGPSETSVFRSGGVYHVVSDFPIGAHLHAPYESVNANASTLLVPERSLGSSHVVFNHGAWVDPNYFVVIAIEDDTAVTWQPSVETAGDDMPVPFVAQGATGMMVLDRFDNLRVETSASLGRPKCEQDLSGTLVTADKPIWVLSAVRGLRLPWCGGSMVPGCPTIVDSACDFGSDFAIEQSLPLAVWGTQYVGAHAPVRGSESHYWRIYAGADNVTVTTDPPQPGTPISLAARGGWAELVLPTGTNVVFAGDGPFMPVQYLTGHHDAQTDMGSPEMIQGVPSDRFLDRYVFVTAASYEQHFAQVTRAAGGAEVEIDGDAVAGWESVGAWEVANVAVSEGAHQVTSTQAFGLSQYGYSQHVGAADNSSAYAYVVGLSLD
ncbi:IgGFc-binding protein [Enhygromyxa salina]|uniref:IgGFc-binding protein N-terminal domain-containing protein n=1 Tax=Enhygromyxa salina TaxID=215803 RepID=A0A2S9YVW9_9BACT|nr:IgGFc-binding protein [Enhygromyxa salina]PRQ09236.1 hypothetical protein ENSA7_12260 [Enhygromyxa salina]